MSSKTKKRLFIALAGLLASSTAAVLVANTGTSSAQVTGNAGCLASIEGACELTPLAWDEAPVVFDFAGNTALATYSALSDLVGAMHAESAQWRFADEFGTSEKRSSFADRQLISDITAEPGGVYNIGPQDQFQPDSSEAANSVRHFNSLRLFAGGGGGISKSASPGTDAQNPGSGAPGGSTPDGGAPGGSTPGGSTPDGGAPGGSAPGGSAPGDGAPGGSAPGDGAPGDGSPIGGPDDPVSVPEPGTTGLLAFGLALVGFMGRRRRAPI